MKLNISLFSGYPSNKDPLAFKRGLLFRPCSQETSRLDPVLDENVTVDTPDAQLNAVSHQMIPVEIEDSPSSDLKFGRYTERETSLFGHTNGMPGLVTFKSFRAHERAAGRSGRINFRRASFADGDQLPTSRQRIPGTAPKLGSAGLAKLDAKLAEFTRRGTTVGQYEPIEPYPDNAPNRPDVKWIRVDGKWGRWKVKFVENPQVAKVNSTQVANTSTKATTTDVEVVSKKQPSVALAKTGLKTKEPPTESGEEDPQGGPINGPKDISEVLHATELVSSLRIKYADYKFVGNYIIQTAKGPFFDKVIELETGKAFKYSTDWKMYVSDKGFSPPLHLDDRVKPVYYSVQAGIAWGLERPSMVNETMTQVIEMILRLPSYNIEDNTITIPDNFEHAIVKPEVAPLRPASYVLPNNIKWFLKPLNEILISVWEKSGKKVPFFAAGEDIKNMTIYVYTNSVPTYRKMALHEFQNSLERFLYSIFSGVLPPELKSSADQKKFAEALLAKKAISEEKLKEKLLMAGVSFEKEYVYIAENAENPTLLQYSEEVFTTSDPIKWCYSSPTFQKGQIMLTEPAKLFLENLCVNDVYIYNVLRGMLRAIITSPYDGYCYQSAIWVCGPAACAKSLWVGIIKRLVPPHQIMEFAHTTNQFTVASLENTKVLIVSDVVRLTSEQMMLLKPMLGRDGMRKEQKNKRNVEVILPKCIVLFISNDLPTSFPLVAKDNAILEKLIVVKYPTESAIPLYLQVPDLANSIDVYMHEIFNWAMFIPLSVLQKFKRAGHFNMYQMQQTNDESIGGLAGYLKQFYLFSSAPDAFTPITDIVNHCNEEAATSGDDLINGVNLGKSQKTQTSALANAIVGCVSRNFGHTVSYERYSRRDKNQRVMGIKGLVHISLANNFKNTKPLSFVHNQVKITLDDPFYAENKIAWIKQEDSSGVGLFQVQQQLKAFRESKMATNFKQLTSGQETQETVVNVETPPIVAQQNKKDLETITSEKTVKSVDTPVTSDTVEVETLSTVKQEEQHETKPKTRKPRSRKTVDTPVTVDTEPDVTTDPYEQSLLGNGGVL